MTQSFATQHPTERTAAEAQQTSGGSDEPRFDLACEVPAGWAKVRCEFETDLNQPIEVYVDSGSDFNVTEVLTMHSDDWSMPSDRYLFLPKPIRAVRLVPPVDTKHFHVRSFTIRPVPKVVYFAHVARRLTRDAVTQGRLLTFAIRGLKALAAGDFRRIREKLSGRAFFSGIDSTYDYNAWIENHKLTPAIRREMAQQLNRWVQPPKFSILMAIEEASPEQLRTSIESVIRQIYPQWELLIAASPRLSADAAAVLAEFASMHKRLAVVSLKQYVGHAAALNQGAQAATGDFIAVLEAGDLLAEHALFRIAREISTNPEMDWFYSDEDQLDADGNRTKPFFKPAWSPELALSSMYTGRISAYRASLLRTIGGWRTDYEGAHHYDLSLRCMGQTDRVRHIADVLYHRSEVASSEPAAVDIGWVARRAVEDHCSRAGISASVEATAADGCHRVRRAVRGNPWVSVVIPTASRGMTLNGSFVYFLANCIQSIRERSSYNKIEIIVVDNNDMPAELADAIEPYDVKLLSYTREFNLSAKMNEGAAAARGEYIVFLNDDIEIITPDWVESMLEHAQDRQVGAVGAKLLFPNDRIQHAGVICTKFGPDHLFYNEEQASLKRYSPALVPRELMAVTGACVMVKTTDHHLIGGWNEALPLNFNDIDLCLKLIQQGRRNVYTPYAVMRHYESASKTNEDKVDANIQRECKNFKSLWDHEFPADLYYNTNFIPGRSYYRIDTSPASLSPVGQAAK